MLAQLYIQNIAVIQKATVNLSDGLNVFTGETGAGKTILLTAIDALTGKRISKDIIRTGETKAVVSALFSAISPHAQQALTELGYEPEENSVLISREITQSGSTCKINGMPATAAILRDAAHALIHLHGQHDTEQLLSPQRHLAFIDTFGDLGAECATYNQFYSQMKATHAQLNALEMDEQQKAQRIDMLSFQLQEIEAAALEDGEEEALLSQKKIIRNSEKIVTALAGAYSALSGEDDYEGINTLMGVVLSNTTDAARYVEALEPMATRLAEMQYEISDLSSEIKDLLDEMDFDPRELDTIERRLEVIYQLKRKYGSTIAEIIEYGEKAAIELDEITTAEKRMQDLEQRLKEVTEKTVAASAVLTKKRLAAAKKFTHAVERELEFLDMPSVKLSIAHSSVKLVANGADDIEFMIVTNAGEAPKPLSKIASGGELSRIMLSIKNVLSDKDNIDTLIFDEVDSGVSGRAAQKIGQKLKQVSQNRQILCVTHLAQVAAYANHHLLIQKEVKNERSYSQITVLDDSKRIDELSRIISGDMQTETTRKSAQEMLEAAQRYNA